MPGYYENVMSSAVSLGEEQRRAALLNFLNSTVCGVEGHAGIARFPSTSGEAMDSEHKPVSAGERSTAHA